MSLPSDAEVRAVADECGLTIEEAEPHYEKHLPAIPPRFRRPAIKKGDPEPSLCFDLRMHPGRAYWLQRFPDRVATPQQSTLALALEGAPLTAADQGPHLW